jgi:hypothetical protein
MKFFKIILPIGLSCLMILIACNENGRRKNADKVDSSVININPKEMKHIGTVDERYQSYNVKW